VADIKQIQLDARTKGVTRRPAWADRVSLSDFSVTCGDPR